MSCNARYVMAKGIEPMNCVIHRPNADFPHGTVSGLRWADSASGAIQHRFVTICVNCGGTIVQNRNTNGLVQWTHLKGQIQCHFEPTYAEPSSQDSDDAQ